MASTPREIFKFNCLSRWTQFIVALASACTATAARRSPTCSCGHLILTKVSLYIFGYHFVEHGGGDVLQRLPEGCSHLVLDLPFEEVIEGLSLSLSQFQNSNVQKASKLLGADVGDLQRDVVSVALAEPSI